MVIMAKTISGAEFLRDRYPSIDIFLKGNKRPIRLYAGSFERQCKVLSKNELDTVIQILLIKKERMSRKGDFPYIYDEMLQDLIMAYEERYGKQDEKEKRRGSMYHMAVHELEKLFKQYFNTQEVRIYSIDTACNPTEGGWTNLILSMNYRYREVEEDE